MYNTSAIQRYRYLIVDDDEFTCDYIVKILNIIGAEDVHAISDSLAAMKWVDAAVVSRKLPDIIICDVNMPDCDGIEYMKYLTEKKFTGGIILISGTTSELLKSVKHLASAHKLNVLGTISKPFKSEQIVEMALRLKSGNIETA